MQWNKTNSWGKTAQRKLDINLQCDMAVQPANMVLDDLQSTAHHRAGTQRGWERTDQWDCKVAQQQQWKNLDRQIIKAWSYKKKKYHSD